MTVQNSTYRADYTGNGVTTSFAVPFYFLDPTHLTVLQTDLNGNVATLALNSAYTVTGAGVSAGGTLLMATAPVSGYKIAVLRNVPLTQLSHFVPNDPLPASTLEQNFDQLTMEVQQLQEQVNRAISVSPGITGVNPTLPVPATGKIIGWNGLGTGLQNYTGIPAIGDANTTTYTAPDSSVQRTVGAKLAEIVSVADNGAIGDGITDDTAALAIALTKAGTVVPGSIPSIVFAGMSTNARQGTLQFQPNKVYKISAPLVVPPGVTLELNGSTIYQSVANKDAIQALLPAGSPYYSTFFTNIRNGYIKGVGSPICSFSGSITGNTLTVGVLGTPNTIAIGQVLRGMCGTLNCTITAGSGTSWTVSGPAQSTPGLVTMWTCAAVPTGSGINASIGGWCEMANLSIQGFQNGMLLQEYQYTEFRNLVCLYNTVGVYMTDIVGNSPPWPPALTCLDNHFAMCCFSNNTAYGLWIQTNGFTTYDKIDCSRNGVADVVLGPACVNYVVNYSIVSGGTGYAISSALAGTIQDCIFNGTISGSTLTLNSTQAGAIALGQTISGAGFTSCTVGALLSGSLGVNGSTYKLVPSAAYSDVVGAGTSPGNVTTITMTALNPNVTAAENSITGTISGSTLTVTTGSGIQLGQTYVGVGATTFQIKAFGTGTGGTGTYTITGSQTIATGTLFYAPAGVPGEAVANTNGSGVITSVQTVDSGNCYVSPVLYVPTAGTIANISGNYSDDTQLSLWAGSSGVIRGHNIFNHLKVEHAQADRPLSGYCVLINSYNYQGDAFNYLDCEVGQAAAGCSNLQYQRWMRIGSRGTWVVAPGANSGSLYTNLTNPANADFSIFKVYSYGALTINWMSQDTMALSFIKQVVWRQAGTYANGSQVNHIGFDNNGFPKALGFTVENNWTGNYAFLTHNMGEAFYRYILSTDGTQSWGGGTAATDTTLSRSAAGVLTVSGSSGGAIQFAGTNGYTIRYTAGTANGSVATTLGSTGPVGSTAGAPQGWMRVNVAGVDRFIPYW